MISFLRLIRIQNLLIIAFTQYMVRWFLILPLLKIKSNYYTLQLTNIQFFLLVLSTVMIAAAGYIINDYFDVKIDKVNKPERMIIDKGIKRRVAIGAHTVINILALVIAGYVAYSIGYWKLVIIHFSCAVGLWFYSTNFKREFLIGNVIIAGFTMLVPLIVGIYELLPCYQAYIPLDSSLSFMVIWKWIFSISFFAGITTLLREIIKDIEDYEGDKEYGCNTMPIVIGIKPTKTIAIIIALATMACLGYWQSIQWASNDMKSFWYFTFLLQLPFVFLIIKIFTSITKKSYKVAGNTTKLIMLAGVCYLFLLSYYLIHLKNGI